MTKINFTFPCDSLMLEGIFYQPEGISSPCPAVVVCHPHPLYGGSMHNNVTYAIAGSLSASGISALIFNFRGVGNSQGQYGDGIAERADVTAAMDWLAAREDVDPERLGLAGYSFGAFVSLPVACSDRRVSGAAFISPFLDADTSGMLKSCEVPRLIISGGMDSMVYPAAVADYHAQNPHNSTLKMIGRADHFWGGHEKEMAAAVTDFFRSIFKL